jgi:hypothetical protein
MSDNTTAAFVYGPAADALTAALPNKLVASSLQPATASTPKGEKPATPAAKSMALRLGECAAKAILYLDDGVSSVDAIAEAALSVCRPELTAICGQLEKDNGVLGFCTSSEINRALREARPAFAANVLKQRARARLLNQAR